MTLKKLLHNFNGNLHTVNSHRRLVRKYCFKLGLYRQGMMHDLSKYSPSEFIPGVKYYQDGHRSPNNAQREDEGVSKAWLHHKGRNKHHFEYWIDYQIKTISPPNERGHRGSLGINSDYSYEYRIYVRKNDYEKLALF